MSTSVNCLTTRESWGECFWMDGQTLDECKRKCLQNYVPNKEGCNSDGLKKFEDWCNFIVWQPNENINNFFNRDHDLLQLFQAGRLYESIYIVVLFSKKDVFRVFITNKDAR